VLEQMSTFFSSKLNAVQRRERFEDLLSGFEHMSDRQRNQPVLDLSGVGFDDFSQGRHAFRQ